MADKQKKKEHKEHKEQKKKEKKEQKEKEKEDKKRRNGAEIAVEAKHAKVEATATPLNTGHAKVEATATPSNTGQDTRLGNTNGSNEKGTGKEKKEKKDKKDKKEKKEKKDKQAKESVPTTNAQEQDKKEANTEPEKKEAAEGAPKADDEGSESGKKLKPWQDDELEVESSDEAEEPAHLKTPSSEAARSVGQAVAAPPTGSGEGTVQSGADANEEVDTLDSFMAELPAAERPNTKGEGQSIMESARVKSITLEEVLAEAAARAKSGTLEEDEAEVEEEEAEAAARAKSDEAGVEEEEGSAGNDFFVPASSFQGAKPGWVFKMDFRGLGYYKDLMMNREVVLDAVAKDGSAAAAGGKDLEEVPETNPDKAEMPTEAGTIEEDLERKEKKKKTVEVFVEERMESDGDASEESSEEGEPENYFDLVKRFTTKKTLPEVDHSKIDYTPFRKNIYIQVKEISNMRDHEVEALRKTQGDIRVRGKHCPRPIKSFLQCGLPAKILKVIEKREYEQPFPIQMQAIPALMCGRDVIGVAQTGSGKTLTYLLPGIRHALQQPPLADGDGPIVFIVAPTRELALQIQREAAVFCKVVGLTSVCGFGGGPMGEQLSALKKGAHVLVGTPGRLIGILTTSNGKITNLRRVTFMVLDEADRMFDMGFEPQIGMFLQSTRPDKQVAMFSATLPTHVEALARQVLKKPLEITCGERNVAAANVTQFVEVMEEEKKFYRLLQLLGEWHEHGSIIIFVHQQRDVDEMFTELLKYGYPPLGLHGGQDQHDRDFTLQDFKDGVSNILIATSVAARGIDVKSVVLVINFKVPDHLEDYIHRIGRAGRAGKAGFAYTFIQPDEADRCQDMVDALRQCNQQVPEKLRKLAEEHQAQINTGQAKKRRRWGGFGGKGFKYDSTEKSQQQKDRTKAKKDLLIGEEADDLNEDDVAMGRDIANRGGGEQDQEPKKDSINSAHPVATAKGAAQIAARLQADAAAATAATTAAATAGTTVAATASSAAPEKEGTGQAAAGSADVQMPPPAAPPPPHRPKFASAAKKSRLTEEEIVEQARQMAEDTLKNLDEELREKQLPSLALKLQERLRKAEAERDATPTQVQPPPPPAPKAPDLRPVMLALPKVPGVIGGGPDMVSRSVEQLQVAMAKPGAGTAHLAQEQANVVYGPGSMVPYGMITDEFEINDYPQVARQQISHKEPLLAIEEMTGAKIQVKGQHFAAGAKLPEGARRLYVEVMGPTAISVQKGKHEVRRMMEALSIRTLNIPGMSRAVLGTPGRYNPLVGS